VELENRFEVPAGLDRAWRHLLDMEKVAACFPGATLSSSDGDEYTGTVKVKLGPIQLTYAGAARIVAVDEATHTATIEASGNAARSGSTATMTVVASASAIDDGRTAVVMKTDLAITGRPAQFGRGVMVEVGNKILAKFATCLSNTLADLPAGDADAVPIAAGNSTGTTGAVAPPAGAGGCNLDASTETDRSAQGGSLDLLSAVRGSIVKRLVPVALGMTVLCLLRARRRRRTSRTR
jgi:carbon monoxide dehydrogenase subunit G